MSTYRAYIVTLHGPDARGVFWLSTISDVRRLLGHFASQWCGEEFLGCSSHDLGTCLEVDRVWLADGFLCDPPTEFTTAPVQYVNECPTAILGAL